MGDDDGDDGLRFTLPPLRLPAFTLPDRIHFLYPTPPGRNRDHAPVQVSTRTAFAVALALDLLDVLVVLFAGAAAPWLRAALGAFALAPLVGAFGVGYVWEGVAAAAGLPWLAVVPSATLLLLARLVW
ncbi:hypothetical protein [Halomicrococcus sp. SG-WS-1]|uniref:hypothetical protein n=1 Tax=Halomicrococcus sp. SG-WS-1 TaxID=3439057 RepID=UPI003F792912